MRGIWHQLNDDVAPFTHPQSWQERHHPAGLRTTYFHTVKKHLGSPARAIGFDVELTNLSLNLTD